MLHLICHFAKSPFVHQIITDTDRLTAANLIANGGEEMWYDASAISRGKVLWAVPGAGWCVTFLRGDRLVLLPCREDGTPTSFASLNENVVGFTTPTIGSHWHVLRPCLVPR